MGVATAAGVAAPWAEAVLTEQQQRDRIAADVKRAEEIIASSGTVFQDVELTEYLQSIAESLFPDHPAKLKLQVQSDPAFNAYCWPNGSIYFHTGALLRMRDEAQLAAVIGHEGAHFTGDHGYERTVRGKKTAGFVVFMVFIDPLLTPLLALSSLAGFSREHEREADAQGFERMVKMGYAVEAAGELFGLMSREFTACKDKQGAYFWASHPRVTERIASFKEMAAGRSGGDRHADRYLKIASRARLRALESMHAKGDGTRLVFLLETERLLDTFDPEVRFYLAEGLRLRNQAGDAERAAVEYQKTIDTAPQASKSYEALGLHHLRAGRKAEALPLFEKFVQLEPNPKATLYAQQYIRQLRKEISP